MHYLLVVLLLAVAVAPATATARTITQDLAVAHRYWQTDICRGEWRVIPDASLRLRGALASTFMTDCTIYLDPDLDACDREYALLHEVGHFVHGPAHQGPMSYSALAEVPCVAQRLVQRRVKARWLAERSPKAKAWWPR
jgi:hypothetical protein